MKKLFFVLAFFSIANIAFPIDKRVIKTNPCFIMYNNSYDYYIRNHVDPCQAQEWCAAALIKCLDL